MTPIRFLFALPGFHQEDRGAEVALLSVAEELARTGDQVCVIGAGPPRPGTRYQYRQAKALNRRKLEWLPKIPPLRSDTSWEDASFSLSLARRYDPREFDVTLTCNFPFSHWCLRRGGQNRPLHMFVTQNGDWPAYRDDREFRFFACDGLVCTNPDYEERNRGRWRTALIPNGIHLERYRLARSDRRSFDLPDERLIVLMVSALIETKRVGDGIRAVAALPNVHLVVAGDGPLRSQVDGLAKELIPERFTRLTVAPSQMPTLYRSADVFLHLSVEESFGNVFVEAMASGLPIVGHDSTRLRWIVGDRDTLCNTECQETLIAALLRALERGREPPDKRINQFSWSEIAERYRTFAQDLMHTRGR